MSKKIGVSELINKAINNNLAIVNARIKDGKVESSSFNKEINDLLFRNISAMFHIELSKEWEKINPFITNKLTMLINSKYQYDLNKHAHLGITEFADFQQTIRNNEVLQEFAVEYIKDDEFGNPLYNWNDKKKLIGLEEVANILSYYSADAITLVHWVNWNPKTGHYSTYKDDLNLEKEIEQVILTVEVNLKERKIEFIHIDMSNPAKVGDKPNQLVLNKAGYIYTDQDGLNILNYDDKLQTSFIKDITCNTYLNMWFAYQSSALSSKINELQRYMEAEILQGKNIVNDGYLPDKSTHPVNTVVYHQRTVGENKHIVLGLVTSMKIDKENNAVIYFTWDVGNNDIYIVDEPTNSKLLSNRIPINTQVFEKVHNPDYGVMYRILPTHYKSFEVLLKYLLDMGSVDTLDEVVYGV